MIKSRWHTEFWFFLGIFAIVIAIMLITGFFFGVGFMLSTKLVIK